MKLSKAQQFIKDKGIKLDDYVIHDITGNYLAPIDIIKWLEEFSELKTIDNISKNNIKDKYCNDCGDFVGYGCDNEDCLDFKNKNKK